MIVFTHNNCYWLPITPGGTQFVALHQAIGDDLVVFGAYLADSSRQQRTNRL
jgi:hypothetical protein